jgi:hypothetical protein
VFKKCYHDNGGAGPMAQLKGTVGKINESESPKLKKK